MKVSVLTITFNHEDYLEQCLLSPLQQKTSFPIELIVGEDCSTDNTRSVLLDLAGEYPGVIQPHLQAENVGMARNFIDTFHRCSGDYIAILDGDDYWTCPQKLERQVRFLDQNPDFAACFHEVEIHEPGKERRRFCGPDQKPVLGLPDLFRGNPIPSQSIVFRNHLFSKFPPWFAECPIGDWPLHMLNAAHGKIRYFDEVMAVYRIHASSSHSGMSYKHRLWSQIATLEKVNGYFGPRIECLVRREITRLHYSLWLNYRRSNPRGLALNAALDTIRCPPLWRNIDWKLKQIARIASGLFLRG